jgi:hypothetical protein
MIAFGKNSRLVTQYIRGLRGGSQPIMARASDGLSYVVKFANNLQGPNVLFNECAGNELYRAYGLPVPEWTPLRVSDSFLDRNPECWMQTELGSLRPASGLCFGSRLMGQDGGRILEILPSSAFRRVRNQSDFLLAWLIDICADHIDNRQAVFVEEAEGWLEAYFIDHGHLFGGPAGDLNRNFRASRYLDPRIYPAVSFEALPKFKNLVQALDVDKLRQRTKAIPNEWSDASAWERFDRCLQRLKMDSLVQNVFETIADDLERRKETESGNLGSERKPSSAILRLGPQVAGFGRIHAHLPHCV